MDPRNYFAQLEIDAQQLQEHFNLKEARVLMHRLTQLEKLMNRSGGLQNDFHELMRNSPALSFIKQEYELFLHDVNRNRETIDTLNALNERAKRFQPDKLPEILSEYEEATAILREAMQSEEWANFVIQDFPYVGNLFRQFRSEAEGKLRLLDQEARQVFENISFQTEVTPGKPMDTSAAVNKIVSAANSIFDRLTRHVSLGLANEIMDQFPSLRKLEFFAEEEEQAKSHLLTDAEIKEKFSPKKKSSEEVLSTSKLKKASDEEEPDFLEREEVKKPIQQNKQQEQEEEAPDELSERESFLHSFGKGLKQQFPENNWRAERVKQFAEILSPSVSRVERQGHELDQQKHENRMLEIQASKFIEELKTHLQPSGSLKTKSPSVSPKFIKEDSQSEIWKGVEAILKQAKRASAVDQLEAIVGYLEKEQKKLKKGDKFKEKLTELLLENPLQSEKKLSSPAMDIKRKP